MAYIENKIPKTIKASFWYTICNILQKSVSLITMPLFTRILTIEEYGQVSIYQSWLSLLSIVLTLNLAYGSFSTAMIKYENSRDEYISSIQTIFIVFSSIFLIIYYLFRNTLDLVFQLPQTIMVLMVFEIVSQNIILLWSGKNKFEYKYIKVIIVTIVISLFGPLLAYIFVQQSNEKGYARIFGYSLPIVAFGVSFLLINYIKGKTLFSKEYWKYAFSFNIPLIAYYISQMIFNQSDRILISHFSGTSNAALYSVAYNLAMILNYVLDAINNSYIPWLYKKIKIGKSIENRKISTSLAILLSLMILCVVWYAPEIIEFMAGKKYGEAVYVVTPVAISLLMLFYSQLFINVEFYYENKKSLVFASIGSALINIILNIIYIPKYGYIAAGYTTLISYILFAISNYFTTKKMHNKLNIEFELYDTKRLLTIAIVLIIGSYIGVLLYGLIIVRIVITIIVIIIVVIKNIKIIDIKTLLGKEN